MAKRKKKKEARMSREQRAMKELTELVAALSCPETAIDEVGFLFSQALVASGMARRFAWYASMTYADRPGPAAEIAAITRALLDEHARYVQAVEPILERLDNIQLEEDHEDLDPHDVLDRIEPAMREIADEVGATDEAR